QPGGRHLTVSSRFRPFSRGTIAAFALALSLASSVHAQQAAAPGPFTAAASAIVRPPVPPDRLAASNYGSSVFLWDNPLATARDLRQLQQADFGWQKSLFKWREIEGAGKGIYDWTEADRIIQASNAAGIKVIARIDFQPAWARLDQATTNAHPDNPMDYADF